MPGPAPGSAPQTVPCRRLQRLAAAASCTLAGLGSRAAALDECSEGAGMPGPQRKLTALSPAPAPHAPRQGQGWCCHRHAASGRMQHTRGAHQWPSTAGPQQHKAVAGVPGSQVVGLPDGAQACDRPPARLVALRAADGVCIGTPASRRRPMHSGTSEDRRCSSQAGAGSDRPNVWRALGHAHKLRTDRRWVLEPKGAVQQGATT